MDDRLYGSFVEHLGRAIYGGIYEPGHPRADGRGFRRDVLELARELGLPVIRYPGGNFVCGFDWEDSVGPAESRPVRLDPAWLSVETNRFGLDEFARWCSELGAEPMLALNLGTRGVDAARSLLEYCNFPGGTRWSDLRRAHGRAEPYGIKLWCLGNELDGPWNIGQKDASEYGRLARETAKAMRLIDPKLELVACGSSNADMPSFPDWEASVLGQCYEEVDYLSLHSYYGKGPAGLADYLACSAGMDRFIKSVAAACDFVKARKRSRKTMLLSFDEWNVWYRAVAERRHDDPWKVGPSLLEEPYTFEDALVVGCLLMTLLKNADRVRIACLAQLVNALAPIMTRTGGGAWRQTIYYPFLYASRYGRGESLRVELGCPRYESPSYGEVPYLEAAAVSSGEGLAIFAVNRSASEPVELEARLGGFEGLVPLERIEYAGYEPGAANSEESPDAVVPRRVAGGFEAEGGRLSARLAPLSWNLLRLGRPGAGR